jgi:Xaa-Pro aminopeptidase
MTAILAEIDLPEFGLPTVEPTIPPAVYARRIEAARARAADAGYDALIVYGDREHSASLAYLTAYDPRFEEALLVIVPERIPTLMVGNEGMAYSYICPIPIERVLYQPLSLVSQPRDSTRPLTTILSESGIRAGMRVGVASWKYYTDIETDAPEMWIEAPAYLVDTLRAMGTTPVNASALFMHPNTGLRARNEIEQLARFEFMASYSSQSVRDAIFGVQPNMTEFEVIQLMRLNGLELSAHIVMNSGDKTRFGLSSASLKRIVRGEPIFANLALWGANTARGGFLVESAAELPASIRDYVEKLVAPYFAAVAEWYAAIGIGVAGGDLHAIIQRHLGDPFFGVTINPGHLIHIDEWVSSPIYAGSTETLQSGMAIQVDVIPATGTPYFTTNIEDGIALADADLRAAFAAQYPEAWARITARRAFMETALGIRLKPEVLPFSNIPAYLPPFWLAPRMAMKNG